MQRRRALHQAVGQAIEELYQERLEEHYTELAHHFSPSETWDKALTYHRQAGIQAFARSSLREALAGFEQALAALHHLPESQETSEQAINLRIEMRNVLIALGDFGRIFELLGEAEALAKTLEDPRRLGWVSAYLSPYFTLEMMATFFLGLPSLALGHYEQQVQFHRRNVEALQGQWRHDLRSVHRGLRHRRPPGGQGPDENALVT
jgi:tetratricopeptide (TPR) repeat protein